MGSHASTVKRNTGSTVHTGAGCVFCYYFACMHPFRPRKQLCLPPAIRSMVPSHRRLTDSRAVVQWGYTLQNAASKTPSRPVVAMPRLEETVTWANDAS